MTRELVTRTARTWLDDAGIVQVVAAPDCEQTLEDAEHNLAASREAAAGVPRPLLVDMSMIKSISREGRNLYAQPDNAQFASAVALLVGNPLTRLIGNFFIGVNRASVPLRLFGSRAAALDWLHTQRPQVRAA